MSNNATEEFNHLKDQLFGWQGTLSKIEGSLDCLQKYQKWAANEEQRSKEYFYELKELLEHKRVKTAEEEYLVLVVHPDYQVFCKNNAGEYLRIAVSDITEVIE